MEISSILWRRLLTDLVSTKSTLYLPPPSQKNFLKSFKNWGQKCIFPKASTTSVSTFTTMLLSGACISKKEPENEARTHSRKRLLESFQLCCACFKRKKLDAPLVPEDSYSLSLPFTSPTCSNLKHEDEVLPLGDIPTAEVLLEGGENNQINFPSNKSDEALLLHSHSFKDLAKPESVKISLEPPQHADALMHPLNENEAVTLNELPLIEDDDSIGSQNDETSAIEFSPSTKDPEKKNKKKKAKKKKDDESSQPRPNYFVAVQVSSPQITSIVSSIQDHIVTQEPRLQKSAIPVATLHLTLLAFHAGHGDALNAACDAFLEAFPPDLRTPPLHLAFAGLGHFRNQVLFGKLQEGEDRLVALVQALQSSFIRNGISHIDKSTFTPHLTIFKLSRDPKLRKKGLKHISPHLYAQYKDQELGRLPIPSLQLLSMTDKKDTQGYYKRICELPFQLDGSKSDAFAEECQKAKEEIRNKIASLVSNNLLQSNDKKDS